MGHGARFHMHDNIGAALSLHLQYDAHPLESFLVVPVLPQNGVAVPGYSGHGGYRGAATTRLHHRALGEHHLISSVQRHYFFKGQICPLGNSLHFLQYLGIIFADNRDQAGTMLEDFRAPGTPQRAPQVKVKLQIFLYQGLRLRPVLLAPLKRLPFNRNNRHLWFHSNPP